MRHLDVIIDALLPGDPELEMPGASLIGFFAYLERHNVVGIANQFVSMLDEVCNDKFSMSFVDLNATQKIQAINACKLVNVRVFSSFVTHLLKAYYINPIVLNKIGAGSIPPFPNGNFLENDEWNILEQVYERGIIYKSVS